MSAFDDLLAIPPQSPVPPSEPVQAPVFEAGDPATPAEPTPEATPEPAPITENPSLPDTPAPGAEEPSPVPEIPAEEAKPEHTGGPDLDVLAAVDPQPAEPKVKKTSDDRPDRSESMRNRHRAALDAVFGKPGVKYEVLEEVHLPTGEKFATPFGNKGRHGWMIREVGTDTIYTIGASALKIGINEYKVIDALPAKPRGRKPKAAEEVPVAEPTPAE